MQSGLLLLLASLGWECVGWCMWVLLDPSAMLSLAKISITACSKLGVVSYGRAWSSGQDFAPGSALLIPEMALGAAGPIQQCLFSPLFQQQELDSPKCSFHGNFVCGQCICHPGW